MMLNLPSIDNIVKMHNIHPVTFEMGFLLIQLTLGNEFSISESRYVYIEHAETTVAMSF